MQGLALTGLLLLLPVGTHGAAPRLLTATVQQVSDGDSVTALTVRGTKLRLRLLGIDAREVAHGTKPGQPYGADARDDLDHLIGEKPIRVDAYGPGQHNLVLGVVWDDQVNVNLLMVAMGNAEVYRGAPCVVPCQALRATEAKARHDRVGIWAQGASSESPATFRWRGRLPGE